MNSFASSFDTSVSDFAKPSSMGLVNKLLTKRAVYHLVFWIFIFVFNAAYISFIGEDREVSLYNLIFRIPFILICCYLNLYFLMPAFYYKGKLIAYFLSILLAVFSFTAINLFLLGALVQSPICPTTFEADSTFNGSNYIYKCFFLFSIIGLTSGIKLSKNHFVERQKADAIEKEKLQTELSFLKSQIQPHFFFNTLNNLYALTIKKSDLAPDVLLKLSDLMSYGLYEADSSFVSMEKELDHISNYIELESLRLGTKYRVEFNVEGSAVNKRIPPLIFLPFVENCFKHAALHEPGQSIKIDLNISENFIVLSSKNPFSHDRKVYDRKGGLGLKNAHRRLHLLYGSNYLIESFEKEKQYCVIVRIPLL